MKIYLAKVETRPHAGTDLVFLAMEVLDQVVPLLREILALARCNYDCADAIESRADQLIKMFLPQGSTEIPKGEKE